LCIISYRIVPSKYIFSHVVSLSDLIKNFKILTLQGKLRTIQNYDPITKDKSIGCTFLKVFVSFSE